VTIKRYKNEDPGEIMYRILHIIQPIATNVKKLINDVLVSKNTIVLYYMYILLLV